MLDWPVMEHWFHRYILVAVAVCVIIGWSFVWIMHLIALFHGYVFFLLSFFFFSAFLVLIVEPVCKVDLKTVVVVAVSSRRCHRR